MKDFIKMEDSIIFQNCHGHYLTPSTIRDTMQGYCKKAGVDYKGTHGFRHTHAVLQLESGANLKYVSNRLGHKKSKQQRKLILILLKK
ncbi:tyrosine-type recombinase/integrase [Bacillus subtilis]|nr:tyrosine-type recombinase/integrase [Bacillus subtilis]